MPVAADYALSLSRSSVLVLSALALTACQPAPSSPALGGALPLTNVPATGLAAPLSDAEFNMLSLDEKYRVVNKLASTMYSGISVEGFYALDSGDVMKRSADDAITLSQLRTALQSNLPYEVRETYEQQIVGDEFALDEQGISAPLEAMFNFDQDKPKEIPLARIYHYPFSRDAFSQWMAWHLANTILFSPAEEIDSADITDVQNLFRRLDLGIMSGQSIRAMVAAHQNSIQNWRRFRSPEDNTREMMEIYLGLFDNDAEVPLASQACQDLYLTDQASGYKLAYTDYPNNEPVLVLDKYITNCREFYDVVANHSLLIPRVVSVLVNYFYAGHNVDERLAITQAINATKPITFEDIFTIILFSKTYLLNEERPRSFEESYLPMAKRLQWDAHQDIFRGMVEGRGALARANMNDMGWPTMSLKLGRVAAIPIDSLSFGNYHKALRETMMLDFRRWRIPLGLEKPTAPSPQPVEPLNQTADAREIASYEAMVKQYNADIAALSIVDREQYDKDLLEYEDHVVLYRKINDMTVDELLDYLFLSAVLRRPNDEERLSLARIFETNGHLDKEFSNKFARSGRTDDIAIITLDYLSRLPQLYYLQRL